MRIVLVSTEYSMPNNGGGIGTYTHTLARSLSRLGHEVHIITLARQNKTEHLKEGDVYIDSIHPSPVLPMYGRHFWGRHIEEALECLEWSLSVYHEVLRLKREGHLDVVHVPDWGAEGFWLALHPPVPLTVTLHGPRFFTRQLGLQPLTLGVKFIEIMERQVFLRASGITSPSREMLRIVAQTCKIPTVGRPIKVIPNPVDTTIFRPSEKLETKPPDNFTVTYVGRLKLLKGAHILAVAIPTIVKIYPQANFRFIGQDTPMSDGRSMLSYIRSLTKDCEESLEFTGPLPRATLPDHYGQSALVVIPSLQESFGYTCAEAMACGACVVASNVGGLAEMIQEGESGFLVPPANASFLAQTIIDLLSRPEERKRVGQNARQQAVAQFNTERITEQIVEFFIEVSK